MKNVTMPFRLLVLLMLIVLAWVGIITIVLSPLATITNVKVVSSTMDSAPYMNLNVQVERTEPEMKPRRVLYDSTTWTPTRPGIYNWSTVPPGLRPALEKLFPTEGSAKVAPVVASIKSQAGGSADRARGLPAVACMSIIMGRPLAVDPNYLSSDTKEINSGLIKKSLKQKYGIPADTHWGNGSYYSLFMAQQDALSRRWESISKQAFGYPKETIIINSNMPPVDACDPEFLPLPEGFQLSDSQKDALKAFREFCPKTQWYSCGALILHAAWGSFRASAPQVELLEEIGEYQSGYSKLILPDDVSEYSMLHMRVSGSLFNITDKFGAAVAPVKGVPYSDGWSGMSRAETWLNFMREMVHKSVLCRTPLLISSDSSRFVSEMAFGLWPKARVAQCCSSPLHVSKLRSNDKSIQNAAERQVLFDLVSLSRAKLVIRTAGGFGFLGQRFLKFVPPPVGKLTIPEKYFPQEWTPNIHDDEDIFCRDDDCIRTAVDRLKKELQCLDPQPDEVKPETEPEAEE